jgi:hypothetical protein
MNGKFSPAALAALFTNLAKGCEKQDRSEEAGLFRELAAYYQNSAFSRRLAAWLNWQPSIPASWTADLLPPGPWPPRLRIAALCAH